MSTYYAEADALEKRYNELVGWCVQYGIRTWYRSEIDGSFQLKSIGQMSDEINKYLRGE